MLVSREGLQHYFPLIMLPFWVIDNFSGILKQWVVPIVRRNKNLDPVFFAPFYAVGLVKICRGNQNASGVMCCGFIGAKYGMVFIPQT